MVGRCSITPVDGLFAFVVEQRLQCNACGRRSALFEHDRLLRLALPAVKVTRPRSLYDLYMMSCVPVQADVEKGACACCGSAERSVAQRRLATMPRVLLVQVCRDAPSGEVLRHPVYVDESLEWPGLPAKQLV